jgi:hypothetical protein
MPFLFIGVAVLFDDSVHFIVSLPTDVLSKVLLEINLVIIKLQNVKGVFDAAIRMVIKPPQKQHEKRKKPRQGCFLSVHFFLYYINCFVFVITCCNFPCTLHFFHVSYYIFLLEHPQVYILLVVSHLVKQLLLEYRLI